MKRKLKKALYIALTILFKQQLIKTIINIAFALPLAKQNKL
ncbi:hypothetical protein [Niastella sp. OAS944]